MKTKSKKQPVPPEVIDPAFLAWPTEPEPMPVNTEKELEGKPWGTLYVGWWMNEHLPSFGSIAVNIGQGCASTIGHSTWRTDETNSQGTGRFYATKADAILALRWALCRKFAKTLSDISKIPIEEPATL